jgi:hypothetical protein
MGVASERTASTKETRSGTTQPRIRGVAPATADRNPQKSVTTYRKSPCTRRGRSFLPIPRSKQLSSCRVCCQVSGVWKDGKEGDREEKERLALFVDNTQRSSFCFREAAAALAAWARSVLQLLSSTRRHDPSFGGNQFQSLSSRVNPGFNMKPNRKDEHFPAVDHDVNRKQRSSVRYESFPSHRALHHTLS